MAVPNLDPCWHCRETGHWIKACPLLRRAANIIEHRNRIDEIVQRFLNGEIWAYDKTRLIKKENDLWNSKGQE
jgi:hypothetical protein